MAAVPIRELRNNTSQVIDRVRNGENVTLTSHGEPVAHITSIRKARKSYFTREDIANFPLMDAEFGRILREEMNDQTSDEDAGW